MKTTMTPEKALLKLADLCSTGEHCKWEICEKLRKWGIQRSDADRIIAKLSEGKFIDDKRFAKAFVHDRIAFRKQGRRMIMRDLILKRIDKDIITDALAEIDRDQYADNLTTLMARKLLSLGGDINDNDIRNRLVRFAAGRGYEPSLIFNALESLK